MNNKRTLRNKFSGSGFLIECVLNYLVQTDAHWPDASFTQIKACFIYLTKSENKLMYVIPVFERKVFGNCYHNSCADGLRNACKVT